MSSLHTLQSAHRNNWRVTFRSKRGKIIGSFHTSDTAEKFRGPLSLPLIETLCNQLPDAPRESAVPHPLSLGQSCL